MSTANGESSPLTSNHLLAVDADRIVSEVFPDFSLRTWRRWDASGRCPRGFKVGGRKVWRMFDLSKWSEWGFPDRDTFEARLDRETGGRGRHVA